ncbi:unnamed protein product [Clavelina lepadiformis]|uniref:Uncharacterized protein n=1 Tax=Clavelina lepadiformis TaxID=159417 RepID=A0ABP0EXR7_CLALP
MDANESQRIDDLSSETEDSTDASRVESHHDCDRVEDEHSEDEEDALPSDESMTSQRQMLDQFFDPRNKKKKIVTSWFKNRRINDRAGNEAWRSAVLISSKQRKRKQAKPPKPSKLIDPAIVENIALVKTFGEAYTKWREKRIKMKDAAISKQGRASSSKEHQSLQKLNYSSLYSANTAQEILEASRQSIQIENAVKSIEL